MKLSIIIPVLNEEKNIGRLLTFLRRHVHEQTEIIVVDGGSQDTTVAVAKSNHVQVIQSEMGRAKQMNAGAALAKGDVFYFIHADTIPVDSFYEDIRTAICQGALIGGYRFKFDSKRWILKVNSWFTRFPFRWCRGGDQTLFVTKELFENLSGFNENFVIMEEYDLMDRSVKTTPFFIVPKAVLVSARKYDKNSWMKIQLTNFKAFRMYARGVAPKKIKAFYKNSLQ